MDDRHSIYRRVFFRPMAKLQLFVLILNATGSGITLYIVNVYGQNLTVSVDGGTPTNHTVPGPSGERCPIPEFDGYCPVYGVAIYNIQGLYTDKPHTLHVVPDARTLYFDYAVVNDTVLSPTSSAAANHSTSGSSKK